MSRAQKNNSQVNLCCELNKTEATVAANRTKNQQPSFQTTIFDPICHFLYREEVNDAHDKENEPTRR